MNDDGTLIAVFISPVLHAVATQQCLRFRFDRQGFQAHIVEHFEEAVELQSIATENDHFAANGVSLPYVGGLKESQRALRDGICKAIAEIAEDYRFEFAGIATRTF